MASIIVFFCGCSNNPQVMLNKKPIGKILIACYSESPNQNTLTVAKWIQEQLNADLHVIKMEKPYSNSYKKVLKESKYHLDNNINPEILPFNMNIENYDIVFIGSPVWYGTFAPPIKTFLSQNDFSGKTVIPFCTHGGGGFGHLYEDIAKLLPNSKVLSGLTLRGSNVIERTIRRGTASKESSDKVVLWLNEVLE